MIKIISRDPSPPPISYIEKSGGMFLDMTIHDFDMVKYLSGVEISEIYVELCVHASVKLFVAADRIPLKFQKFRVNKLFTLTEHFSQVKRCQFFIQWEENKNSLSEFICFNKRNMLYTLLPIIKTYRN